MGENPKESNTPIVNCLGVIFAGGVGRRMHHHDRPKQFIEVNGKPIIIHTLEIFEACSDIDEVVVVFVADWIDHMQKITSDFHLKKVSAIVPGGEQQDRSQSIMVCLLPEKSLRRLTRLS